nr:PBAN [Locusta migratoria]UGX04258.1 pyrokinin [Locusta migratoria]
MAPAVAAALLLLCSASVAAAHGGGGSWVSRREGDFTPRLGRESAEQGGGVSAWQGGEPQQEEQVLAGPFVPRLGRGAVPAAQFSPRLGRRDPPVDGPLVWLPLQVSPRLARRRQQPFVPRLGRDSGDEWPQQPFVPRLGRRLHQNGMPFSPRLGRDAAEQQPADE